MARLERCRSLARMKEVIEMSKRTRVNAAIAVVLSTGALAASLPAASLAQASTGLTVASTVEPGGGGH
jgi:acyl-CoA synthetase (NDP forming)